MQVFEKMSGEEDAGEAVDVREFYGSCQVIGFSLKNSLSAFTAIDVLSDPIEFLSA